MTTRRMIWATTREWLAGLTTVALVVAPMAGCPRNLDGLGGDGTADKGGLTNKSSGFFINEDTSSDLLVAGRNDEGHGFFVYGSRNAQGRIGEIRSIVLRTVSGERSFLTFASGRPTHAEAPDGSYAHVTYTEVSASRLTGTVDIFNAGDGSVTPFPFVIDLRAAIDDVVAQVRAATGIDVRVVQAIGDNQVETRKSLARSLVVTIIPLYTAFVIPCAALIYTTTIILGQLLTALVATVVIAIQNIIIAIFTPFILLAELMGDVVLFVRLVPVVTIFDVIPDPPIIVLR